MSVPPSVLGIDLASKNSALVLLDADGQVVDQRDSVGLTPRAWAQQVADVSYGADVVIIEDLPAHVPWGSIVKTVCMVQGRILQALPPQRLQDTWFVTPAVWQQSYEGVWKGKASAAATVAAEFGYEPPDVVGATRFLEASRTPGEAKRWAKKVMTDYVDAYLIAQWGRFNPEVEETTMVKSAVGR